MLSKLFLYPKQENEAGSSFKRTLVEEDRDRAGRCFFPWLRT